MHVWLDAVTAVSDLTKLNWVEVFGMSVIEFFSFIQYHNFRVRREERQIKKLNKKR